MAVQGETKVKKPRALTTKQRKFVKAKAEGLTGVAAAQIAYDTTDYNTAAMIASDNLRKPNIQEAVQAEMAKQGITLEAIIRPVKEALEADKVSIVGNGEKAMAEVTPDHSVRLKAVSIASQFMGIGKNNDNTPPSIHFHGYVGEQKASYDL
jgi:phage terminase small subunit